MRGDGGPLTTIATTEPGDFGFFGFDTAVNDAGRVASKAELDAEFGFDEGLFSGRGGPVRTHYLASNTRFGGDDSGPSITTIADDSGPIGSLDKPSLNDDGFVAFLAFFDEGGEAILLGNGGRFTPSRPRTARSDPSVSAVRR